ncbi:fatty acid desaturase [Synechococcus sp. RSCCF101]|nr:fatty acid desaturase [Synechococcus sp. RSCCF101]
MASERPAASGRRVDCTEPVSTASVPARSAFCLKPYLNSSNLIAGWQISNTLLPYLLLWGLALVLLRTHSLLLAPVLVGMVLFLARLFVLMHDCGHNSLFRSRRVNRICGFLLGIVCGLPQLPWSRGHEFHHTHNGNWDRYRGPSALATRQAFNALSPAAQQRYRLLRHPLMLVSGGFFYLVIKPRVAALAGLAEFFGQWVSNLRDGRRTGIADTVRAMQSSHWHSPEEALDILLNNLAVVSLWLVMAHTVGAGAFWLIYAPVMACAAALFICIFFVQHNFPNSYAERSENWDVMAGNLLGTSDLELPAVLNWFTADIGCHSIHHLCSAVPNYRLRACHQRNRDQLGMVRRLRLSAIWRCFSFVIWDRDTGRLVSLAACL